MPQKQSFARLAAFVKSGLEADLRLCGEQNTSQAAAAVADGP